MELGNMIFGCSRGPYEFPNRDIVDSWEWGRLINTVCDGCYGFAKDEFECNARGGFSNDIFEINPYYWGDCDCGGDDTDEHSSTCSLMIHNFVYKPTGFWIDWYKYPFRDSYMSHDLTEEQILEIFKLAYEQSGFDQ